MKTIQSTMGYYHGWITEWAYQAQTQGAQGD